MRPVNNIPNHVLPHTNPTNSNSLWKVSLSKTLCLSICLKPRHTHTHTPTWLWVPIKVVHVVDVPVVFGHAHHLLLDVIIIRQGVALAQGPGRHPLGAVGVVQWVLHHLDGSTLLCVSFYLLCREWCSVLAEC